MSGATSRRQTRGRTRTVARRRREPSPRRAPYSPVAPDHADNTVGTTGARPVAMFITLGPGYPVQGGVAATIQMLTSLLNSIGVSVYTMVFHYRGADRHYYRRQNLNLLFPLPPMILRLKDGDLHWLYSPDTYYPDMKKLKNVLMIIGFSLISSEPAISLRNRIFPKAHFYLVNVFPINVSRHVLHYREREIQVWLKSMDDEYRASVGILSIGSEIYNQYKAEYKTYKRKEIIAHHKLKPTVDMLYFKDVTPVHQRTEGGKFQILTFFDKQDIMEFEGNIVLMKAMRIMTETLASSGKDIPTWNIFGVRRGQEHVVNERINPHPKLNVVYRKFPPPDIDEELCSSLFYLPLPSTSEGANLALTCMALSVPILLSKGSDGHKCIYHYLPRYIDDVSLDMQEDEETIGARLVNMIVNRPKYLEKAVEIRQVLEPLVAKATESNKKILAELVQKKINIPSPEEIAAAESAQEYDDIKETKPWKETDATMTYQSETAIHHTEETNKDKHPNSESSRKYEREPYTICVHLTLRDGVPEDDKPMEEVEEELFQHHTIHIKSRDFIARLINVHQDLDEVAILDNCHRYILKCGNVEAIEALWKAYGLKKLDEYSNSAMQSIFIAEELGARFFKMEAIVYYEDFVQCVAELKEKAAKQKAWEEFIAQRVEVFYRENDQLTTEVTHLRLKVALQQDVTQQVNIQRRLFNSERETFDMRQRLLVNHMIDLKSRIPSRSQKQELMNSIQYRKKQLDELDTRLTYLNEIQVSRTREVELLQVAFQSLDQGYALPGTVRMLSQSGSKPGQVRSPSGLAIDRAGNLVVADKGNNRVQTLSRTNQCEGIIKFHGFIEKLFSPSDIAVCKDGKYWITDSNNRCLMVCDDQSNVSTVFGWCKLRSPTGICVSEEGFAYVADNLGNSVLKYDMDGFVVASTVSGQVVRPWSVVVNSNNQVLVSGWNCIYVLSCDLESLSAFGHQHLNIPRGLCLDSCDHVYVCDRDEGDMTGQPKGKVVQFSPNGQFLCDITPEGVLCPNYIAVYDDGRIICTDEINNCIKVLYT
ncbi:uncharacterized protein [Ptychodera flava]|uniref:uncharacterized protein isoform X2 n=1 Tax=Ptychodera flava TaxID=63121 RepID=UPI00396AA5B7